MNDALFRHLKVTGRRSDARARRACWLGTQYERAEDLSQEWDEHMEDLFGAQRAEVELEQIGRISPGAVKTASAVVAVMHACPPDQFKDLSRAIQAELRKARAEFVGRMSDTP